MWLLPVYLCIWPQRYILQSWWADKHWAADFRLLLPSVRTDTPRDTQVHLLLGDDALRPSKHVFRCWFPTSTGFSNMAAPSKPPGLSARTNWQYDIAENHENKKETKLEQKKPNISSWFQGDPIIIKMNSGFPSAWVPGQDDKKDTWVLSESGFLRSPHSSLERKQTCPQTAVVELLGNLSGKCSDTHIHRAVPNNPLQTRSTFPVLRYRGALVCVRCYESCHRQQTQHGNWPGICISSELSR